MNNNYLVLIALFLLGNSTACQKITDSPEIESVVNANLNLPAGVNQKDYTWDETSGEIVFNNSLNFSNQTNQDLDKEGFYWNVHEKVKTITIARNTIITGGIRAKHSITIQGEDRTSSILFGTNSKNWSLGPDKEKDPNSSCSNGAKGDDYVHDCEKWKYGAISSEGDERTTITVKNLTIENARAYAITGFKPKFIIENVHMVITRPTPDYHSNSDGISAGPGSIIRNSKIDVWDDAIKLYRDFEVENVTIIHNSNGAPFQFGWGDGIKSSNHSLKNVLVFANNKQHSNLALFSASLTNGEIERKVDIDGIKAIYGQNQKVRNDQEMPLVWLKSQGAKITLNFKENSNIHLEAPALLLGSGTLQTNLENQEGSIINKRDQNKITGCGW